MNLRACPFSTCWFYFCCAAVNSTQNMNCSVSDCDHEFDYDLGSLHLPFPSLAANWQITVFGPLLGSSGVRISVQVRLGQKFLTPH